MAVQRSLERDPTVRVPENDERVSLYLHCTLTRLHERLRLMLIITYFGIS